MTGSWSSGGYGRVLERRRAVALARHYREFEGLSIRQIAGRLGRSPATVKAYFYDPTGEKARAVKARYVGEWQASTVRARGPIVAAALALMVVIASSATILLSGTGSNGRTAAAGAASAPSGPFLTAATMPHGLSGRPAPRFTLLDARAGSFSSAQLARRPYVLTLLYVHCVDVCPLIGSETTTPSPSSALGPAS